LEEKIDVEKDGTLYTKIKGRFSGEMLGWHISRLENEFAKSHDSVAESQPLKNNFITSKHLGAFKK